MAITASQSVNIKQLKEQNELFIKGNDAIKQEISKLIEENKKLQEDAVQARQEKSLFEHSNTIVYKHLHAVIESYNSSIDIVRDLEISRIFVQNEQNIIGSLQNENLNKHEEMDIELNNLEKLQSHKKKEDLQDLKDKKEVGDKLLAVNAKTNNAIEKNKHLCVMKLELELRNKHAGEEIEKNTLIKNKIEKLHQEVVQEVSQKFEIEINEMLKSCEIENIKLNAQLEKCITEIKQQLEYEHTELINAQQVEIEDMKTSIQEQMKNLKIINEEYTNAGKHFDSLKLENSIKMEKNEAEIAKQKKLIDEFEKKWNELWNKTEILQKRLKSIEKSNDKETEVQIQDLNSAINTKQELQTNFYELEKTKSKIEKDFKALNELNFGIEKKIAHLLNEINKKNEESELLKNLFGIHIQREEQIITSSNINEKEDSDTSLESSRNIENFRKRKYKF